MIQLVLFLVTFGPYLACSSALSSNYISDLPDHYEPIQEVNSVDLVSGKFTLSWIVNEPAGVLQATMRLNNLMCWAGIGLRSDSDLSMGGNDFIIGQELLGQGPVIQEYHADASDPHDKPLVNKYSNLTSRLVSATLSNDASEYKFIRVLNPSNGILSDQVLPIRDGDMHIVFAWCKNNQDTILKYHGNNHAMQTVSINWYTGTVGIDEENGEKAIYAAFVIGGLSFFILAVHAFGYPGPLQTSDTVRTRNLWCKGNKLFTAVSGFMLLMVVWTVSLFFALYVVSQDQADSSKLSVWEVIQQRVKHEDISVFYCSILILAFCLLFNLTRPTSVLYYLHRQIKILDLAVGELILICGYIGLNIWFIIHYNSLPSLSGAGVVKLAKIVGHLNELNISLLILPMTRNSLWVVVFCVPFERAIRYHRNLGKIVFLLVNLHLAFWWREWVQEGNWISRAIEFDGSEDDNLHRAIWSGTIAWGTLLILCLFAYQWIRRRHYTLFRIFHYFSYAFIALAVFHSRAVRGHLLEYLIFGLCLYAFDRIVRFYRSNFRNFHVIAMNVEVAEVVRIEMAKRDFARPFQRLPGHSVSDYEMMENQNSGQEDGNPALPHTVGQYCFLNCPIISTVQWHPFSISSRPGSSTFTFHMKDMGPSSWTHRLKMLAANAEAQAAVWADGDEPIRYPEILVDGPHGCPNIAFGDYEQLLLVAGGIGITPIACMIGDLFAKAERKDTGKLVNVTVIWVVKEPHCLLWFSHLIELCRNHESGLFTVRLFVTNSKARKHGIPRRISANDYRKQSNSSSQYQITREPSFLNDNEFTEDRDDIDNENSQFIYRPNRNVRPELAVPEYELNRPQIRKIVNELSQECKAQGIYEVGTFVCGPLSLIQDVEKYCLYDGSIVANCFRSDASENMDSTIVPMVSNATEDLDQPCPNRDSDVRFDLHKEVFLL